MASILELRFARPLVFGALVAFLMFWGLNLMVSGRGGKYDHARTLQTIDFVRLKKESELETRQRLKPKPPPPPKEPPPPPQLKVATEAPQQSPLPFNIPNLALGPGVCGGPFIGALSVGGGMSGDLIPLVRIAPLYPRDAAMNGIEGWVKIELVVNADGTVRSAKAVDGKPRGVFEAAAINAIYKWKFKPKIVDGQAVEQHAFQTLDFKLTE